VAVLALILGAIAVGLDNFAVAVGLGVGAADRRARVRIVAVFGIFEALAPIVGIVIGNRTARAIGHDARFIGGGLLVLIGVWLLGKSVFGDRETPRSPTSASPRLLLTAGALSIDNLVVGFGLGITKVPLPAAIAVFALVSIVLSVAGLEIGRRLQPAIGARDDLVAGAILVVAGALVVAGVL
jgi:manganese efflux pump family protein